MMETTLERHGRHLLKGGDEGIPTSLPSSIDDIAGRVDVQHKRDDLRTGPITRARAKLLEQHVNSLLTEYNLFTDDLRIATSILLRLNIPLCFDLEYFPFTTLLRSGDFYFEDQV
jgi:hypothetical protein